ncbi:MAG TPA: LacI family DNA-binding transcriptional regulator [Anaerolineae bacterium]|nr:LacI family DNA-binding transcriptional regulator [Anaerolineae bacterium]
MTKRRVTSWDVAELAKVSRTTVSFVLNNVPGISLSESTRQRVLDAARKLNYHPDSAARKLVSGKSHTLGLVLRQSPEQIFTDAFLPQVILGLGQATAQQGFHVLLNPLEPSDRTGYARLIHEKHVDGIVLSGPRQDDRELIDLYREGVPVMLIGQLPEVEIPFVDVNAVSGAATAVNHLLDLGHRRIGMITNAPLEYTSAHQRLLGYRQALEATGSTYDDGLIKTGNFTPASGIAAMDELLKSPPHPTAVFVASDVVAMGAAQAIKRAGLRIPEDIALVGFDDVPLAAFYDPPLTTIRLPAYGLGWAAGERLIRLILGEDLAVNKLMLETELIVRESSAGRSQES